MMCHGMKSVQYGGGTIERLGFHTCRGILNNKNYLLTLSHDILRNIKTLTLNKCEIDQHGLRNLAECIPHTSSLTRFVLVGNQGVPGGIPVLMEALRERREPLSLDLRDMTLEKSDVTALLDLLQIKTSCIKTLALDMRDMTSSTHGACRLLQKVLALSLSLETLHLFSFPVKAFEILCAINENIRNLEIFLRGSDVLTPRVRIQSFKKLCHFISENKSLQQLTLDRVLHKEASAISQSLRQNHTLRKVLLVPCSAIYRDRLSLDPRINVAHFH